ncbi:UDP-N-acetylmuramate--L-alanine ligase [soil metagenome]
MHIFFSGIGGTAIGPLALIASQAGFKVSGSDKQDSQYVEYLRKKGISDISIGQSYNHIQSVHEQHPIDWYVYSSAVIIENPDAPELQFCHQQSIKTSKRDELINLILQEKQLKLIAVAGTHGKTTTTAMVIWLFKQLNSPVSYSVGAKISFGDMGQYEEGSEYFVYECDEFDRNFLSFEPYLSLITGVSWDHHEIFPTREDYQMAFREFISQSAKTLIWQDDQEYLGLDSTDNISVLDPAGIRDTGGEIRLFGLYNRLDAWLAVEAVRRVTKEPAEKLIKIINRFPGGQRRMEKIAVNLFSDYAHTPDKIRGAMSVALEMAAENSQELVVVYEALTNRRQHYMLNDYKDCFEGAKKVYWVPSYLAREDPTQRLIPPEEMISHLSNPEVAEARERDNELKKAIEAHMKNGDMVVAMAGGGGDSLDEWIREKFKA